MEAVRVRHPDLVKNDPFVRTRGLQSAAFLKSGTLNASVTLLLQIGLPSRRIAQEVVAREELTNSTVTSLRAWLRAHRYEPETRWTYLASAVRPIWISFLTDSSASEHGTWATQNARLMLRARYSGRSEVTGPEVEIPNG